MKKIFKSISCILLSLFILISCFCLDSIKANAASRRLTLKTWFSDSKMGEVPKYLIKGRNYYLCFKIFDANTGEHFNIFDSRNYTVKMTVLRPNKSQVFSYTYDKSDYNWIRFNVDSTGTYTGRVTVAGSIRGGFDITIDAKTAQLRVETWTGKSLLSMTPAAATKYFSRSATCYYRYRLYDQNTNTYLDKLLPSSNYTVTQRIINSSGQTVAQKSSNDDSGLTTYSNLSSRSTYTCKTTVSGDFTGDTSFEIYTKYYSDTETYSFTNSRAHFFGQANSYGQYYMLPKEINLLNSKVRNNIKNNSKANKEISKLTAERQSSWGGSCFGMSVTTVLDKLNKIGLNENFGTNNYSSVSNMYSVKKPYMSNATRSAINYYHLSQYLSFIDQGSSYSKSSLSWKSGLKKLVEQVKNNRLTLFSFYWKEYNSVKKKNENVGHTIVLQYAFANENGGFTLLAYDPSIAIGKTTEVFIDKDYKTCTIPTWTNSPKKIEFTSDFSSFDKIDIDGSSNIYRAPTLNEKSSAEEANTAELTFDLTGNITIVNEEGEALTYTTDGDCSGDLEILSEKWVANGADSPLSVVLEVNDSESFAFSTEADELNVSVVNKDLFASSDTKNADGVVVSKQDGLAILGNNFEHTSYITYNENGDMFRFIGSGNHDVFLEPSGNSVSVFGMEGNCEVTSFVGEEEPKSFFIEPNYSSFAINKFGSSDTIAVYGSNDDEHYDIPITAEEKTYITGVSLSEQHITMTMGDKHYLNFSVSPANADDKAVYWATSDESIVSVDENGCITATGVGNATISASISNGEIVNECEVTSLAPPVNGIHLDVNVIEIQLEEEFTVEAIVIPDEAINKNIIWRSENSAVATVDHKGTIKGLGLGKTNIVGKTEDGGYEAVISVTVTPIPVSGVLLSSNETIELTPGGTVTLVGSALPENATNSSVVWSSSNDSIATVDQNGLVRAVSFGEATITIKSVEGGFTESCVIHVNAPETPPEDDNADRCPQCGQVHEGFFGKIVGFFHRIIYRLTHLFG